MDTLFSGHYFLQGTNSSQIPIKERKELSCRQEVQVREDKSAEQKAKPYQ